MCQQMLCKVHRSISGRFRTNQRTAVICAFACQHAIFKAAANAFILTEQIADFFTAYTDIPGRHIQIGANMSIQFGHKCLTEAHNLCIGFAARIKVGPAFAAANH